MQCQARLPAAQRLRLQPVHAEVVEHSHRERSHAGIQPWLGAYRQLSGCKVAATRVGQAQRKEAHEPTGKGEVSAMTGKAEQKSFDTPDETRMFDHGVLHLLQIGGGEVGRLTLQPGWRWSQDVKPLAGTDL